MSGRCFPAGRADSRGEPSPHPPASGCSSSVGPCWRGAEPPESRSGAATTPWRPCPGPEGPSRPLGSLTAEPDPSRPFRAAMAASASCRAGEGVATPWRIGGAMPGAGGSSPAPGSDALRMPAGKHPQIHRFPTYSVYSRRGRTRTTLRCLAPVAEA